MALTEELLKYDEEGAESSDDEKEECEELWNNIYWIMNLHNKIFVHFFVIFV